MQRALACLFVIGFLASPPTVLFGAAAAPTETVLGTDFEDTKEIQHWRGKVTVSSGFQSRTSLLITNDQASQSSTVTRILDVDSLRGRTVRCSAMIRGEGVSVKPNAWNGVKLMMIVQSADGSEYPQAEIGTGNFDWTKVGFRTRVPGDATNVTLVLGLENVTGKAWFDDLKVVARASPKRDVAPLAIRYKGHTLDRLRGAMVSPRIDAESLRVLGRDWKANLIRYQLIRTSQAPGGNQGVEYDTWVKGELARLDVLLPKCEEHGIMVVLDLHSPPGGKRISGGYYGADGGLFQSRQAQDQFVELWKHMATRYKNQRAIWGYDLANEPVEGDVEDDCLDWPQLSERAAKAIREIDPVRTIIVEPADWGGPGALKNLVPLPISNVVYSVHMYLPHAFTHQNVHEKGPEWTYPGKIKGEYWDKVALERALQPVVDFQKRYNTHIYLGEFSAIRWAPNSSAGRYLTDVIEIFERHGWDWSYHAFREWQGWSAEHGSDPKDTSRSPVPTDRQQLLQRWFQLNEKPAF